MQTIGERLEEARKKKGISIREAAEATKIRGDYLQRFESNQFDIGLTEIYTRGFLRNYANFLKLPAERILNDYAALGRGDIRPRQPNREIYGRMDITVATAGESGDRAASPEGGAAEPAANTGHVQPRYPRGSGPTLPSGPDPATVFKYVKIGGVVVAVVVAVLLMKSCFSGKPSAPAPDAAAPTASGQAPSTPRQPAAGRGSYKLIARDAVFIRVTKLVGKDGDGEEVFSGSLAKGQQQILTWNEPVNVWASAGENVDLEWDGKVYPFNFRGYNHMQLLSPPKSSAQ